MCDSLKQEATGLAPWCVTATVYLGSGHGLYDYSGSEFRLIHRHPDVGRYARGAGEGQYMHTGDGHSSHLSGGSGAVAGARAHDLGDGRGN